MNHPYFFELEDHDPNKPIPLAEVIEQLAFNEKGLMPVITQDAISKNILMFAWINKTALLHTIETKRMTYWSRSRQNLWIKGESSGHAQALKTMSFDCDGDVILCQVEQTGAACHTGRNSCFYLRVNLNEYEVNVEKGVVK